MSGGRARRLELLGRIVDPGGELKTQRLCDVCAEATGLFRAGPGKMGPADLEVAQAFADVATIAILQHRAAEEAQVINEQLTRALNSRVVIEQAKGMIAERLGLDMGNSFAAVRSHARTLARSHARNRNLRLADVADAVVRGTLAASKLS